MNSFDEDVPRSLAFFTRLDMDVIDNMCNEDIREAKKLLAFEVTKLVHVEEEALKAKQTAEELFAGIGISDNMPTKTIKLSELNVNVLDLLVNMELVGSKSEGRRLVEQNGISINQVKETNGDRIITKEDFTEGFIIVQKGKKVFLKIQLEA